MDTKMQALDKAQKEAIEQLKSGRWLSPIRYSDGAVVFFSGPEHDVTFKHKFVYSEPKPLEKDTLCLCDDGIIRYAMGELDGNGINKFYVQGFCSKNVGRGYHHFTFKDFEIIETPCELERVQTPDHECINSGCSKYFNKWQRVESDNFLNCDCKQCMVLIGIPSNFEAKK